MPIDAVDLEVIKASLSGIVQEMQNSLFRTGFSTIVRESQDASCAIMNAKGEVVAQHVVLPLHIGAFPACCGGVLRAYGDDIAEGDAFLINHPYEGGSPHAPDMCVIVPVFVNGALFGFCSLDRAQGRHRRLRRAEELLGQDAPRSSTKACTCRRCAIWRETRAQRRSRPRHRRQ